MLSKKSSVVLLEMLKDYDVEHIFGLPGETTLPLYMAWDDFPEIHHVLARDERSAAFMADAYARLSFKPGVCESPSVGSTHMIPGVAEAYKASVPMVAFTSDIPLYAERKNMLTGLDQTSLYEGITKETITLTKGSEIPGVVRRAFRIATCGRPGPVHIRVPMDIFGEELEDPKVYAQKGFSRYPGSRPAAETSKIQQAVRLLAEKERPILVCGQGTLHSQAWNEVVELAELFGIPVGTTITGKGSIAETHPLSIGVIGARGGTEFSNRVLEEADLVFYIGSDTDSATTDNWTLPSLDGEDKVIHLDISGAEVGNNFPTDIGMIGDARTTLRLMVEFAREKVEKRDFREIPRIKKVLDKAEEYQQHVEGLMNSKDVPVHPMRFMKAFTETLPENHVITTDPGVSAIYPSAFYKEPEAGRRILFNYALGALGYSIPASVGAYHARPESCVVALTGDGSFGFTAGELETISRVGGNINVIHFNNGSYGWIKAALRFSYEPKYFDTDFQAVEYAKIAEGFGLKPYEITEPEDLVPVLETAFSLDCPTFIDIQVKSEDKLVPPVPSWSRRAEELGVEHIY